MGSVVPTIAKGVGAVASIAKPALNVVQFANSTFSAAESLKGNVQQEYRDDVLLQQLRDRSALEEAQTAQDAALARAQIAQKSAEKEAARKDALRRSIARQRALFGAGGLDASAQEGSSEAVLLGLLRKSEREKAENEAGDALTLATLDTSLAQKQSLNLLQAAQLAKKQDMERLFD